MAGVPLSGFSANVVLPAGVTAQIYDCRLIEEFREQNAEAFSDEGFGSGTLTGQRLHGAVVGWLTQNDPGIGAMHSQVPITFTAANGCMITGNFNITRLQVRLKVGEVSIFTALVASVGAYSKVWLLS